MEPSEEILEVDFMNFLLTAGLYLLLGGRLVFLINIILEGDFDSGDESFSPANRLL